MKIVQRYCAEQLNEMRPKSRVSSKARQLACEGWLEGIKNGLLAVGGMIKDLFSKGSKGSEKQKETIEEQIQRVIGEISKRANEFTDSTVNLSGKIVGLTVPQIVNDVEIICALAAEAKRFRADYNQLLKELDIAFDPDGASVDGVVQAKKSHNKKAYELIMRYLRPLEIKVKQKKSTVLGTSSGIFTFAVDDPSTIVPTKYPDADGDADIMYLPECTSRASGTSTLSVSAAELNQLLTKAKQLNGAIASIDSISFDFELPDTPNIDALWEHDEPDYDEDEDKHAIYWHAAHIVFDSQQGIDSQGFWSMSTEATAYLLSILETLQSALAQSQQPSQ